MIRVVAKINNAKDEETANLIKEAIKGMVGHIPVKVGDYWMYGVIPVEFEKAEKEK